MLIRFSFKNFKSFKNENCLDMEATSLKEHEYNVAKTENGESGSGRNRHKQYATDESGGYSYESGCTGQCDGVQKSLCRLRKGIGCVENPDISNLGNRIAEYLTFAIRQRPLFRNI